MKNRIYLDHNATTPHAEILKQHWPELIELSGNPSSIHQDSRGPKTWLRETRQKLAQFLNCSSLEIVFNSGASEGNNSILKSVWELLGDQKPEMLISSVEHPSVIKTAEYLKTLGAIIHYIPVDRDGQIDLNFIKNKISSKTSLVSVMYANNETGVIFPVEEIAIMAHQYGALMHSDCVQLIGKSQIDFSKLNLDYATFSAHKIYATKGLGFVYIKKSSPWQSLIHGGGQERSRRGGTENIIGIAALGIVFDLFLENSTNLNHHKTDLNKNYLIQMQELRDYFEKQILMQLPGVTITAANANRLVNTSSLVISGVDGETLLMSLDLKGFSVSTGAACSSGNPEPSPVLLAMGLSRDEAQSSLRVSLGIATTLEQIQSFIICLYQVVTKLRKINSEEIEHRDKKSEFYEAN